MSGTAYSVMLVVFAITPLVVGRRGNCRFYPVALCLDAQVEVTEHNGGRVSLGSASVASFNTYILGIGQPMAGLRLFSGFLFRSIVFAVAIPTWLGYLMWQAHRMQLGHNIAGKDERQTAASGDLLHPNRRHYLVVLNSGLALMIVGAISWSWDLNEFCAVLIGIGVLAGLAGGLKARLQ